MNQNFAWLRRVPFELYFWIIALVSLGFIDPYAKHQLSLCPLDNLGFNWCPGCGLGRAMKLIYIGEFEASFQMHPLAGFAFIVLLFRITELIKQLKTNYNYGKRT